MEITIKAAAEMFKVGRSTIYKKIDAGELSRLANGKIETSELFRVFGSPTERNTREEEKTYIENIKTLSTQDIIRQSQDTAEKEALKEQVKRLEESLGKAYEREEQYLKREEWQRQHIEKLIDTIKLLEPPKPQIPEKPKGFFRRLFSK